MGGLLRDSPVSQRKPGTGEAVSARGFEDPIQNILAKRSGRYCPVNFSYSLVLEAEEGKKRWASTGE